MTAVGFQTVTATGAQDATATLIGSKKADAFVSDAENAAIRYNDGRTVNVGGFYSVSMIGNGGDDVAELVGGTGTNSFAGRNGAATFGNGSFVRNLSGISHVKVGRLAGTVTSLYKAVLYDSALDDLVIEEGDQVTMMIGDNEAYQLIAFDQVTTKKEMNEGDDRVVIDLSIDSVIDNDGWDIQR